MRFQVYRRLFATALAVVAVTFATTCQAHFLWIKTVKLDGEPQALFFFGEGPAGESYHFPDKLAQTKVWSRRADGKRTQIETKKVDTEDRVGYLGALKDDKPSVLQATQQYGIYGTALLVYHPKHIPGATAEQINSAGSSKDEQLEIVPHIDERDVKLTILWDGKPLPEADVTVIQDGKEPSQRKADTNGRVEFKAAGGELLGVLANTIEKEKSGELDGKPYKGVMHYATLTFNLPSHPESKEKEMSTEKSSA